MPIEMPYIAPERAGAGETVPVAAPPDKRITVGKIALGVFLGNLLTGILFALLYSFIH